MPAPEIWGRLFFACTKRLLAPSSRLHQAVACTKRLLAPSSRLHQAVACAKRCRRMVSLLQELWLGLEHLCTWNQIGL